MTSKKETYEEEILFAVLIECLCQQVNMLEGRYKQRAKQLVGKCVSASKELQSELFKGWDESDRKTFEELYDHVYMVVRKSVSISAEDMPVLMQQLDKFTHSNLKLLSTP